MDLKCFLLHLLRIIYGKCDRSRTNSSGVTQCLVTWQPLLHMSPAAALIAKTGSPSATKWHYIFMAHTHTLSQQSIRRQRNLGEYISLTHTLSSCHISSWYAMHYTLISHFIPGFYGFTGFPTSSTNLAQQNGLLAHMNVIEPPRRIRTEMSGGNSSNNVCMPSAFGLPSYHALHRNTEEIQCNTMLDNTKIS